MYMIFFLIAKWYVEWKEEEYKEEDPALKKGKWKVTSSREGKSVKRMAISPRKSSCLLKGKSIIDIIEEKNDSTSSKSQEKEDEVSRSKIGNVTGTING